MFLYPMIREVFSSERRDLRCFMGLSRPVSLVIRGRPECILGSLKGYTIVGGSSEQEWVVVPEDTLLSAFHCYVISNAKHECGGPKSLGQQLVFKPWKS